MASAGSTGKEEGTSQTAGPSSSQPSLVPPHVHVPWISVSQIPVAQIPQKVDERCFFYCSQTTRGRAEGQPPMCRSICIRKIFPHELTTPVPNKNDNKAKIQDHTALPLPPEGQPCDQVLDATKAPEEVHYWKEGWYLWTSRSPWFACEKMETMRKDLPSQIMMRKFVQKREEQIHDEWAKRPPAPVPTVQEVSNYLRTEVDGSLSNRVIVNHPPIFSWQLSSLVHLPSPLGPLREPIEKLLAPTFKVMEIVGQSFESGDHQELAMRMWEKARSPEPFILARNVCRKVWEKLREGPPDADANQ